MRSDPHRDTGVGWFMMCKCCNVPICSSLLHLGCITDEKSIPHSFDFWTKLCCGHGHVFVELCQLKLCYSSYSHFCWTMSTPVRHSNRSRTCPILEGPSRTPKTWNRFLVWVKVFRFSPPLCFGKDQHVIPHGFLSPSRWPGELTSWERPWPALSLRACRPWWFWICWRTMHFQHWVHLRQGPVGTINTYDS